MGRSGREAARPPVEAAGEPATRTLVLGMVAALMLLVAGFFLIQWMFLSAPKDVTVPNVVKLEESAANFLTNSAFDPSSKIPEYKVCAVRVERLPE